MWLGHGVLGIVLAWVPEVTRSVPPPPSQGSLGFVLIALFVVAIALLRWLSGRLNKWRGKPQQPRRSTGVGNALVDLNSMLLADRPNVEVVMQIGEDDERDDIGDGRDPERPTPPSANPPGPP